MGNVSSPLSSKSNRPCIFSDIRSHEVILKGHDFGCLLYFPVNPRKFSIKKSRTTFSTFKEHLIYWFIRKENRRHKIQNHQI